MFARTTHIQGPPDHLDDAIRQYREETLPAARGHAGFAGGMLLADRRTGDAVAITLWETEENMSASEQMASQQRAQVSATAGASGEPQVARYEVVVSL
ncbi:MAG TPA: hypothetical protein VFP55_03370 [Solirubrobacteraceae bacterium]|nr:hypothetical protein [Solirubrobacteraceae bacterium]